MLLISATIIVWIGQEEHGMITSPSSVSVFAGNDRTDCLGSSLLIQDLQATITGDVSDGDWISYGDGRFQPGDLQTVRYSTAQTLQIQYVPGPNDIALGFYRLLLLSDVPKGKPQERGTAEVKITFQTAPPLFCLSNFTIALNESCSQKVDATMIQSNPTPPFTNYIIELYTKDGNRIADNTLTKEHVGKEISYKLGHKCTSNFCYGSFFVEDYLPPIFTCKNDTVSCNASINPEKLGFPFPKGAWVDTIIDKKYIVKDWDKCSDVTLEFTDQESKGDCSGIADKTILRKWKAKDARGNISNCTQSIVVKRMPLSAVTFPPNFDGKEKPFFECDDIFPVLANGYPSPDTTGIPGVGYCGHLRYQYSDLVFEECGNTYRIARNWFVIDWCSSESRTINQLIYIKDTKGPELICRDTIRLVTSPYSCNTDQTPLPDLIKVSDCNTFGFSFQLKAKNGSNYNTKIINVQDKFYFKELPIGIYTLTYIVTDACGNSSQCVSTVIVEDKTLPYPVCSAHTKVTLDNTGRGRVFAFSFDNGSSDNCEIDFFKVRRMNAACGKSTDWGDYVDFCCEDIGTTQMVAFEITDKAGNKNTCMVEVNVEDKLRPTIICPPDITLACTDNYDLTDLSPFGTVVTNPSLRKAIVINNFYHKGIVGKDGLALDNCSVTVESKFKVDINCYTGYIYRTFIATDHSGNKDSCRQIITILNPDPFTDKNITAPSPYIGNGCKVLDADPKITGKPTFTNLSCANVAATYTDQNFYLADSACVKIIRTWSVLDWCQFDQQNPKKGIYQYIQTIKLSNSIPPTILSSCQDTSYCSFAQDCGLTSIVLTAAAEDECTAKEELVWTYQVDIDNDGTVDFTGHKSRFEGDMPIGKHSIQWTVSDQCGNVTKCKRIFKVQDCKKPTPYCISSLTKSLDAVTGAVEISAKNFDNGSSDNCTAKEGLIFTFDRAYPVKSKINQIHFFKGDGVDTTEAAFLAGAAQKWNPLTKSSVIHLDCNNIKNGIADTVYLKMSVTDQNGFSDYCTTELILQDNADVCPDVVTRHAVSGTIKTEDNKVVKGVEVRYKTTEKDGSVVVDKDGKYTFPDLGRGNEYVIEGYRDGDPLEGVSTMDIVFIQRHILGLAPFTSPYQMIAADIDDSKVVTASDLTRIRKLILGITNKLPNDRPAWLILPKNGIKDPGAPLYFDTEFKTGTLLKDIKDADFVAVKIGDVNYTGPDDDDFKSGQVSNRSNHLKPYPIHYTKESLNDGIKWAFRASEDIEVDALQLGLKILNGGVITKIEWNISTGFDYDQAIHDQLAKVIMYHATPIMLKRGDLLFEVFTNNTQDIPGFVIDNIFKSELYVNGQSRIIKLQKIDPENKLNSIKILNNPVSNQLILAINNVEDDVLGFDIVSTEGSVSHSGVIHCIDTSMDYGIDLPANLLPGIYILHVHGQHTNTTLKFIYIK